MIIKSIIINNFKNFIGENKFNLNSNINILYAENGFGKSSFFDAIEWCLTGKISRFDEFEKFNDEDIINYNAKEENHICSVEIEFDNATLIRSFKVRKFKKYGRKSVKIKYLNDAGVLEIKNSEKDIDVILNKNSAKEDHPVEKIKQTHILSQDQITEFINKEDPKKRYKSLLSIMGIENTTNINNNLKGINRELDKKLSEIKLNIDKANIHINNLNENKEKVCEKLIHQKLNELKDLFINFIDFENKNYDEFIKSNPKENIQNTIHLERTNNINKKEKLKNIKEVNFKTINEIKNEIKNIEEKINKEIQLNNNIKLENKKLETNLNNLVKNKNEIENLKELKSILEEKENEIKSLNIENIKINDKVKLNIQYEKYLYAINNKSILDNFNKEKNRLEEEKKLKLNEIQIYKNNLIEKQENLTNVKTGIVNTDTKSIMILLENIENISNYVDEKKLEVCPVCNSNLGRHLHEAILNNIFDIKQNLMRINKENTNYLQKKENILLEIKNIKNNIDKSEKKLSELDMRIKVVNANYTNIVMNGLYNKEIFEKTYDKIKIQLQNIKENLNTIKTYEDLTMQIKTMKLKYEDKLKLIKYQENHEDIDSIIGNIKNDLEQKNIEMIDRDKSIKKYQEKVDRYKFIFTNTNDMDFEQDKDIDLIIDDLNKDILKLNDKNKNIEEIYEGIYKLQKNKEQDIKINTFIVDKNRLNKIYKKIEKKIEENEEYIKEIVKYSDEYIDKYINKDDSPIKQYYRYLNPMPNKQYLYFESLDEKLTIKLKCREDGNIIRLANKTLSSGQLNVLALSIFLAMSENQKINDLELIAIDDPIQNMDDVNQFSVCDILGNLKKQLIFSTHDIEFVKLFLKKNTHRKEKITVFTFNSPYLSIENIKEIRFNKKINM